MSYYHVRVAVRRDGRVEILDKTVEARGEDTAEVIATRRAEQRGLVVLEAIALEDLGEEVL